MFVITHRKHVSLAKQAYPRTAKPIQELEQEENRLVKALQEPKDVDLGQIWMDSKAKDLTE